MSRFVQVLIAAGLAGSFATAATTSAKCNADNCARAVTGTAVVAKPSIGIRMADCSAALEVTTTPAATTVTVTATTITVPAGVVTPPARLAKKAVSTLPTYASACTNLARFSSACACWSAITTRTVEAPTPTVTVTATATVTSTPEPPSACDSQTCANFDPASCSTFDCYCFQIDGKPRSVCSQNFFCTDRQACNLSSECPEGTVCATNTCCGSNGVGGKTGVCAPAQAPECQNPNVPVKLFRRAQRVQPRQDEDKLQLASEGRCADALCSNVN